MRNLEIFVAPIQFKFAGEQKPGVFTGYGSVFHNMDSHKDVIAPGAFTATLAKHKQMGTLPGMYAEHSPYLGGDPLPIGVWNNMEEDDHGLKVEGKISALDTDHGRRIMGLMQDGGLRGLSIAYHVPRGGAVMGKKQNEPRRTLTAVNLHSVDIVRDPSNSAARIQELKAAFSRRLKDASGVDPEEADDEIPFAGPDVEDAIEALSAAIVMQDKLMSSYGYGGSAKDCALLMDSLRDAYKALTGERVPDGLVGWTKSASIGGIRTILVKELGLSRKRADDLAKLLFGSLPRDEGSNPAATVGTKDAMKALQTQLADFSLPKS